MANSTDSLRRWVALFCLTVSFGMLVWGETLLKRYLEGPLYFIFWTLFFAFAASTVFIGVLDVWIVKRRSKVARRELLRKLTEGFERNRTSNSARDN